MRVAQERADVLELDVARGVALLAARRQQFLSSALGHHNHRVRPLEHPLFQRGEKAVLAVERQRDFRDEGEIHVLTGDRGPGSDESGVATHELDQGDAVMNAVRFGVGAMQHLGRFLDRRQIAEGARDKGHVIINRLGNADDRQRMAAPLGFLEQGVAAALGAVAAEGEQDVHAAPDQVVHRQADIDRTA